MKPSERQTQEDKHMTPPKNEIVVYQPDDIMRIEVRFEDETVWLQQPRIAELYACSL